MPEFLEKTMNTNVQNHLCPEESILVGGWDINKWDYNSRRCMQEIIPGLFLGPYSAAMKSKLKYLKDNEISHIVCIRDTQEAHFIKPNFEDHFKYLVLDITDSKNENIMYLFEKVNMFIDDKIGQRGKVLVHGNTGVSRSAALVIAYLIKKFNISYKIAHEHVMKKRLCIQINERLMSQVKEYEAICQARLMTPTMITNQRSLKRRFDEL